jgi:hypothetical protein
MVTARSASVIGSWRNQNQLTAQTKPQKERFIEAARAPEGDEDKERFEAKRMAKAKPTPSRAGSQSERK